MKYAFIWSIISILANIFYQWLQPSPTWVVAAERSWFEVWTIFFFYWYLKSQGQIVSEKQND